MTRASQHSVDNRLPIFLVLGMTLLAAVGCKPKSVTQPPGAAAVQIITAVIEPQQKFFPAENALARTELNPLLATVQPYKALGGGGSPSQPPNR